MHIFHMFFSRCLSNLQIKSDILKKYNHMVVLIFVYDGLIQHFFGKILSFSILHFGTLNLLSNKSKAKNFSASKLFSSSPISLPFES